MMHKKPGASVVRKFAGGECSRAVRRGLDFIYAVACAPEHFAVYGSDLLNCFYFIADTSRDAALSRTAGRMGRERARQWRRERPALPPEADADTILDYIQGSYAADCLGFGDPQLNNSSRAPPRVSTRATISYSTRSSSRRPRTRRRSATAAGCGTSAGANVVARAGRD